MLVIKVINILHTDKINGIVARVAIVAIVVRIKKGKKVRFQVVGMVSVQLCSVISDSYVRFQVLTAASIKMISSWDSAV
jgi:hypothetical protein